MLCPCCRECNGGFPPNATPLDEMGEKACKKNMITMNAGERSNEGLTAPVIITVFPS